MEQNDIKKSINAMSHVLYFYLSDNWSRLKVNRWQSGNRHEETKIKIMKKLKNRIVNMLNIESTD